MMQEHKMHRSVNKRGSWILRNSLSSHKRRNSIDNQYTPKNSTYSTFVGMPRLLSVRGARTDMYNQRCALSIYDTGESVFLELLSFTSRVDQVYSKIFKDLDCDNKGFVTLNDINLFATRSLLGVVPNIKIYYQTTQYKKINAFAKLLFSALRIDSEVIRKKQVLAFCSVYEFFKPHKFDLLSTCLLYTSPSPRDS